MVSKTKIIASFLVLVSVFFLSGCGLRKSTNPGYKIKLEVWGLFDDSDAFREIFQNYREANKEVADIEYKKLTPETYKKELVEALAAGQGPDIFLVQNTWILNMEDTLAPAPSDVISQQKFTADFVDVAANDFIDQGKIYAAPLSIDSLGLYYNKDIFNQAGITTPPKTWDDFIADAGKLTKFDSTGQITQSGTALGTARNINRASDILMLLMLQNGTKMINDNGKEATFASLAQSNGKSVFPGENALSFYTQFARNSSSYYSWNPKLHYSLDAFSEGTVAMMLNYSWQTETIASKSPKLNFAVAPVPQLSNAPAVNYANYWGFGVAKTKGASNGKGSSSAVSNDVRITEAWKFLKYLTAKPEGNLQATRNVAGKEVVVNSDFDPAADYLEKVKKPAARRDLIETQKSDPILGVFAQQNLIAKSWRQNDPEAVENIFLDMIEQVNRGQASTSEAIDSAEAKVTQTMRK